MFGSLGEILRRRNFRALGMSEARRFAKAERESLNLKPNEEKDLIKNRTIDHYIEGDLEATETLINEALKRHGIF